MSTPSAAPETGPVPIALVSGLREVAGEFDLLLCDVWGVLHDGITGFATAGEALRRYRQEGGRVVLVSNAPRPGENVAHQLDGFGIPREAYDDIVTSGDVTRGVVERRGDEPFFHLGPERDLSLFNGLAARFADVESCGYVVCTGLFDDEHETVSDYAPLLARLRERGLLMVCANPDIVVERGAALIPCAGAIAAAYELLGGETYTGGKPHRPIYDVAAERAAGIVGRPVQASRILAIGDALRTDIAGGQGFGVETLMLARGIHAEDLGVAGGSFDPVAALAWLARQPIRPDRLALELVW